MAADVKRGSAWVLFGEMDCREGVSEVYESEREINKRVRRNGDQK